VVVVVIVLFSCSYELGCRGLQRQGMELLAHPAPQRLIDHLVLLTRVLPAKAAEITVAA
jgi:hypothetical protein